MNQHTIAKPDTADRTFVLLKPDAVRRGLIGEIISRIERKGLRITGMRMGTLDDHHAAELYAQHEGKPHYEPLIEFMTSGPSVALRVEGAGAVTALRHLIGSTDPLHAAPGTVRGDFATAPIRENLVHASDTPDAAARETALFF